MTEGKPAHASNAAKAARITISWSANKSILWAIIHGFLSWFYVST